MATLLAYDGQIIGGSPIVAVSYQISIPTTGYTDESASIMGEPTQTYKTITITTDKNNNTMANFHTGMIEDYPININGTKADFSKLAAHDIIDGGVKFYFTSVPSASFNVLIREAI